MYLVVGTYQGSPSDRYLLAFPVELQLIEIVTKYTVGIIFYPPKPHRSRGTEIEF